MGRMEFTNSAWWRECSAGMIDNGINSTAEYWWPQRRSVPPKEVRAVEAAYKIKE